MRTWKLLPLFLLATACSSSPDSPVAPAANPSTTDPGFNQALRDYEGARESLRAKRCDEKSCFVPRYPKNKALLEEIRFGAGLAETVVNYPAEVGAREKARADTWRLGVLAHATKIETSVNDTETKLAAAEAELALAREKLRQLSAEAAGAGCALPPEGKVIHCEGVAPPLESIAEARGLLREMEYAGSFREAYLAIQNAYGSVPNFEGDELLLARRKAADLGRYLDLIRPTFGNLVREMVKARWAGASEGFKASGIAFAYPAALDRAFRGEPAEAMLAEAETGLAAADTFAGFAKDAGLFDGKAIDRIEVTEGSSEVYAAEAFAYHPAHEKSLTVKINSANGSLGLNWFLMGVPSKSDERYVAREGLIEKWKAARAHPPKQEEAGTVVPVSIHVDKEFLDGLVKRLTLAAAIATVETLAGARANLHAKLDAALRSSGRALKGNERIVLCDARSCGRAAPGTFVLQLSSRNPELTEARLADVINRLIKSL